MALPPPTSTTDVYLAEAVQLLGALVAAVEAMPDSQIESITAPVVKTPRKRAPKQPPKEA